jgi:two-component system cell cycle sensor histidine kinase/response regulator CckA
LGKKPLKSAGLAPGKEIIVAYYSNAAAIPIRFSEVKAMSEDSKTILLVDDEDSIRNLAALVLEGDGYRVLKAQHSDEALILLDSFKETVHLLLTDVKMDPFLSGCELAKCIRLMRPDIGVLYISGYSNNPMVQQEVEEARAAFLAKPFSPHDLLQKVKSTLVDNRLPA